MQDISSGDSVSGSIGLTTEQALTVIALSAVSSDGTAENDEVVGMIMALTKHGVGSDHEAREVLVREAVTMAGQHGLTALTATAVAGLPRDRKETALRLAFSVIVADGAVPEDELQFIGELQRSLGISDVRYGELLAEI